jgi:hypothetical protein
MTATPQQFDELHRALGQALVKWQHVETGLYIVTHCLLETKHELSSTVFFHIQSTVSKLSLADKLCKGCITQDDYQNHWRPMKKEIGAATEIRNGLAHFDLSVTDTSQLKRKTAYPLILSPNLYDESAKGQNGQVKALFVEDIQQTATWFQKLAQQLVEFVPACIPQWENRTTTLPQEIQRLLVTVQSGKPS